MVSIFSMFFFFNDTATTEIYTLSLHDALPIFGRRRAGRQALQARPGPRAERRRRPQGLRGRQRPLAAQPLPRPRAVATRSEEHTSELQSRQYLVCRLLLEKTKRRIHATPPLER